MRSSRSIHRPSSRPDAGTTFVEVLVAIAILSISLGGFVAGTVAGWRQLERSRARYARLTSLVQLEQSFRESVTAIRPGYWESAPVIVENNDGYSVVAPSRIESTEEDTVFVWFSLEEGVVSIRTQDGATGRYAVEATAIQVREYLSESGYPRGIELSMTIDGTETVLREGYGTAIL